jgi:hypothetical protein
MGVAVENSGGRAKWDQAKGQKGPKEKTRKRCLINWVAGNTI